MRALPYFLLALLIGCATPPIPKLDARTAITSVLGTARVVLQPTTPPIATTPRNGPRQPPPSTISDLEFRWKQKAWALQIMDVSHCPEDFRQAWFDFTIQYQKTGLELVSIAKARETEHFQLMLDAGAAYYTGGFTIPRLMKELASPKTQAREEATRTALMDSWLKVQRVCLNYGLTPDSQIR